MSMNNEWSDIDRARLAAYFDATGYISIAKSSRDASRSHRNPSYSLKIAFTFSGKRRSSIMTWLSNLLGIDRTIRRSSRVCILDLKTKKKRKCESFQTNIGVYGERAYDFLHAIYPYTLVHREEADIAFVFYNNYVLRNSRIATQAERDIAEECFQKLQALHKSRLF